MIFFPKTRIHSGVTRSVNNAQLITAEGQPLVADNSLENGVAPCSGSSSEVFVGVSYSQQRSVNAMANIEDIVVAEDGTFSLSFARNSASNCRFALLDANGDETALALTAATPGSPTTGEIEPVSASSINFHTHADNAGKTIRAYYRYAPTNVQSQMLQGDVLPGGDSGLIVNTVGVIVAGDVYTTEFDANVDWKAGGTLKVSATGLFTLGGSGTVATGARVISVPTAAQPYLGISLNHG